jgi:hypothetical protein
MNNDTGVKWWMILLSPLLIIWIPVALMLALICIAGKSLYLRTLVITRWKKKGINVLLIYSDSPHWKERIENEIIPQIKDQAVILNTSISQAWGDQEKFADKIYSFFGGRKDMKPMAIVFHGFSNFKDFRFYQAYQKFKKGNDRELLKVESDFLGDIERPKKV